MTDLIEPPMTLHLECSLQCGSESSCADCQKLGGINKEIESAEDLARQAKTRRSFLLARVNSRRDLLTSKLPIEIVGYIFEDYVRLHQMAPEEYLGLGDGVRPYFFTPIHRSGPLRLGAVCQKWRKIAWAHSKLWKTLFIPICNPGHDMGPTMVAEWLRRASEQQLEIQMNNTQINEYEGSLVPSVGMVKNAISVVRALNSASSRWRSLDISACPLDIVVELDNTGCSSKSLLQHLCLGYHPNESPSYGAKLLEDSMHSHQPTHLNLLCPIRPSCLNIGWSQLTHLYLEDMSRKHIFRTLAWLPKSSPALRHLTLRLMVHVSGFYVDEGMYNLKYSALESLVLYEQHYEDATTRLLFSAFTLPALQTLKYRCGGGLNKFPTQEFLSFLHRSACPLETLEMIQPCMKDDEVEVILRAVPTVRTLKIRLTEDNHSAFLFECLSQERLAPILPDLVRLDVTATAPEHWMSFIGMFADNPSVDGPEFCQRRPIRHALQVTFNVQLGTTGREPDLRSLWQLAFLWKKYRFFVMLQLAGRSLPASKIPFLSRSYRIRSMASAGSLDKFKGLKEVLTAMSTLSF